ncbi:MAG: GntR family transcriptional regulator [Anaerolineae bacterium]|nr:GntR family transcriptional regulator [Anaerolineae bacterium]
MVELYIIYNLSCCVYATHKEDPLSERSPIRLTKKTLSEAAADALRTAILSGQLKPNEWLRQEAIADELGISQITVRDALNQLAGEGLVVRIPYKGIRVVSLTAEDIENVCGMRELLEGLAMELAAERITDEELDRMRALLHSTTITPQRDSMERARRANREFHEIAIHACRKRFLIQLLRQVWDWLDPHSMYGSLFEVDDESWQLMLAVSERDLQRHYQLIDALEARDGEAARRIVQQYVRETWEGTRQALERGSD